MTDAHGHQEGTRFFVNAAMLSLEVIEDPQFILPGESGELAVKARGGTPPYTYVWYHEGVEALTDAEKWEEESRLPITEPGVYWCEVKDAEGFTAGADFFEQVGIAITEEPQDCNMRDQGQWYFAVGADGGVPPYRYEWFEAYLGSADFSPMSVDALDFSIADSMFPDRWGNRESAAFSVYCVITDAAGATAQSRTADAYNLMVEIVPDETAAGTGAGRTLSAAAFGDYPPFAYDWHKLVGMTTAADEIDLDAHGSALTVDEPGYYACVVTDSKGHQETASYYLEAE